MHQVLCDWSEQHGHIYIKKWSHFASATMLRLLENTAMYTAVSEKHKYEQIKLLNIVKEVVEGVRENYFRFISLTQKERHSMTGGDFEPVFYLQGQINYLGNPIDSPSPESSESASLAVDMVGRLNDPQSAPSAAQQNLF